MLSERARRIGMSPTMRVSGLAKKLRAEGVDVLDFSVGEPDQPTPEVVKEAGRRAIDENRTRYTANEGTPELRAAICDKLRRENDLSYEPDEVLVSSGAKASLFFAVSALFGDGDEVLVPSPYWVSFPEQIKLAGAEPVIVPTSRERRFKLTPEDLDAAVTPRTRGIILNYPSNPTGSSYDRDELLALARVCERHDLIIVADEIYEKLVYDGRTFTSIASLSPEIKARTVTTNGMSKSYSMTGWRIGFAAGPREVVRGMARIQSHSTSNACSISQAAATAALQDAGEEVGRMVAEFAVRRDEMVAGLGRLPGISVEPPDGAFYVFPDVSGVLGAGDDAVTTSEELAIYLLERARVAVVPGEGFGAPGFIRISYAASVDQIRDGLARIGDALAALRRRE